VAKDPANGDGALRALYAHFAEEGATQDLYRVLLHQEQFRPNDKTVQNNLAQLSLLLNLNVDRGQRLARELYEKEPQNPVYVSTYAFALFHGGDARKAAQLMHSLGDEQLRRPELAAYYGIMLAAAGEHERAAEYLDLGEKAGLLPEERALLERARRTIAQR
jgi:predicted Zn-dependent protease